MCESISQGTEVMWHDFLTEDIPHAKWEMLNVVFTELNVLSWCTVAQAGLTSLFFFFFEGPKCLKVIYNCCILLWNLSVFFLFFSIYIYILCLFNFNEFCSLGDFDILEIQPYSGFTFIKHITETWAQPYYDRRVSDVRYF